MSSSALSIRPDVLRAFAGRDFAISRSYRLAFLLDAFYGVLQLAVYFFISRTLTPESGRLGGAPTYFAFAAVGMVIALVVQAASQGLAFRVREQQISGNLEMLVAQPLSTLELCAGMTGFPFLFALGRAAVYLAIAAVWMKLDVAKTSWPGLVITLVVGAVSLSSLGIAASAIVIVLKRGDALANTAIFAMSLLGGSVFPISALPSWLQPLAKVVPLRFAYDGARAALFRGTGWGVDALVLAAFALVAIPLSVWIFGVAVRTAAHRGSLAQY